MYSRLEEVLFPSSPASSNMGLPSTINWVAEPRFSRWGIDKSRFCCGGAAASPSAKSTAQQLRSLGFI
jgi:hypothetical protein